MPLQIRFGGDWITPSALKIFSAGAWRDIKAIKIFEGGAWRDVANFTAPGGGSSPMTISLNTHSINKLTFNPSATTSNVTATPSGGLAPYTYSWVKQSGGAITASTSSATTAFNAGSLAVFETRSAVFRCACTDSLGASAFDDVSVSITRDERPTTGSQ